MTISKQTEKNMRVGSTEWEMSWPTISPRKEQSCTRASVKRQPSSFSTKKSWLQKVAMEGDHKAGRRMRCGFLTNKPRSQRQRISKIKTFLFPAMCPVGMAKVGAASLVAKEGGAGSC